MIRGNDERGINVGLSRRRAQAVRIAEIIDATAASDHAAVWEDLAV